MLSTQPPKYAGWSAMTAPIRKGERGWRAYAVQCAVNVEPDGIWGDVTEAAVRRFQKDAGLVVDGVVGPATQAALLRREAVLVGNRFALMPDGQLAGFVRVEGANLLAPTNWYTPPGGNVGVDCGPAQIRIYRLSNGMYPIESYKVGDDTMYGLKHAFDPTSALTTTARMFTGRISNYRERNSSLTKRQLVECAVLAHNAPFLAEQIVRNGRLSTPNAEAVWTTKPGGGHYTHAEWAKEYPARILTGVSY